MQTRKTPRKVEEEEKERKKEAADEERENFCVGAKC